jgi:hypothetical protein
MSTIAFDGNTLAADSQISGSYSIHCGVKIVESPGELYCMTGNLSHTIAMVNLLHLGVAGYERKEKFCKLVEGTPDFTVVKFIKASKVFLEYDNSFIGTPLKNDEPWAIGSGARFAMGAMLAGAEAYRAVYISSKLDPYTNDNTHTNYNINTGSNNTDPNTKSNKCISKL